MNLSVSGSPLSETLSQMFLPLKLSYEMWYTPWQLEGVELVRVASITHFNVATVLLRRGWLMSVLSLFCCLESSPDRRQLVPTSSHSGHPRCLFNLSPLLDSSFLNLRLSIDYNWFRLGPSNLFGYVTFFVCLRVPLFHICSRDEEGAAPCAH